jgi:mono/diheme cytochrome c family protein
MRSRIVAVSIAMLVVGSVFAAEPALPNSAAGKASLAKANVERGRYLAIIGGCNDCHTSGYAPSGGNVPEREWLKGDSLGFRGPWGTTYAPNLRAVVASMSEDRWVEHARKLKTRPPMPWFTLNQWTSADLRAIYRYIRGLGPVGDPAPAFVPPDKDPAPPFIAWPAPPK